MKYLYFTRKHCFYNPLSYASLTYGRLPKYYKIVTLSGPTYPYHQYLGFITDLGQAWKYDDSDTPESTFSHRKLNIMQAYKSNCNKTVWVF